MVVALTLVVILLYVLGAVVGFNMQFLCTEEYDGPAKNRILSCVYMGLLWPTIPFTLASVAFELWQEDRQDREATQFLQAVRTTAEMPYKRLN